MAAALEFSWSLTALFWFLGPQGVPGISKDGQDGAHGEPGLPGDPGLPGAVGAQGTPGICDTSACQGAVLGGGGEKSGPRNS